MQPVPEHDSPERASLLAERATIGELIQSARRLSAQAARTFLGVTGPPGSGKSTVAELLVAALRTDAVLISMDGFHLANDELLRLGRLDRKGAPDTFDAGGFVHLLRRLHDHDEAVVVRAPIRPLARGVHRLGGAGAGRGAVDHRGGQLSAAR